MKDKNAKKLIDQLLDHVPEKRLGGSFENLKQHMWFNNLDWKKLLDNDIKVPYYP